MITSRHLQEQNVAILQYICTSYHQRKEYAGLYEGKKREKKEEKQLTNAQRYHGEKINTGSDE